MILCLCVEGSGIGLHWGKGAIRRKCQLDSSKGPNCHVWQVHVDHGGRIRSAHFTFIEGLMLASSVQSLSRVQLFVTPWTIEHQASLSITNSQSLLKLMSIKSLTPSTVSSSIIPFSSCPQSFPESRSFPVSQFFSSGGQSVGVSALVSVLPMNIQD